MAKEGWFVYLVIYCFGCVFGEKLATGTNHTFVPKIERKFDSFDWRHNGDLVVEVPATKKPYWYQYENRAILNTVTGDLTLKLVREDSGKFECHSQLAGVLTILPFPIEVIDPVPKPEVICSQNDRNATLRCSVNPSLKEVRITWSGPNGFSHVGESFQITKEQTNAESVYFCTAKNDVSEKGTEFKLQNCPSDGTLDGGSNLGWMAGLIVGILMAVIGGVAALAVATFIINKKKGANRDSQTTNHGQDPASTHPLQAQSKQDL